MSSNTTPIVKLFEPVEPPREHGKLPINKFASWLTWSAEFRPVCRAWEKHIAKLKKPQFIRLLGGRPYDYTFSLCHARIDGKLAKDLDHFVNDLYEWDVPRQITLLTGIIGEDLSGRGLHYLFAYFRDKLAQLTGNPICALYAPLSPRQFDFPLHADLYIPKVLFNVFEDVPDDDSGASLFLSVSSLKRLLPGVRSLPGERRADILKFLTDEHETDLYSEFYGLLYGSEHEWNKELAEKMLLKHLRIKLKRGQGYIIHDRRWLHGREAPTGGVPPKRLHRLIFNTRKI
jgi:hypothetical protein